MIRQICYIANRRYSLTILEFLLKFDSILVIYSH